MQTFKANDIIKSSRELVKKHFLLLIGLGILATLPSLISGAFEGVLTMISGATETFVDEFGIPQTLYLGVRQWIVPIVSIVLGVIGAWLGLGYIRALIQLIHGEKPNRSILTSVPKIQILHYIGGSILYAGAVILGLIALIVPGIYIAVRLSMFQYLIAEGYGWIDALKTSRAMTKGHFWKLVGIGFYYVGIVIVGILALLIGLFWAMPLIALAQASVYLALKKNIVSIPSTHGHDPIG